MSSHELTQSWRDKRADDLVRQGVMAERERVTRLARHDQTVEAACIAFVGQPWAKWDDRQHAACRERMRFALEAVLVALRVEEPEKRSKSGERS